MKGHRQNSDLETVMQRMTMDREDFFPKNYTYVHGNGSTAKEGTRGRVMGATERNRNALCEEVRELPRPKIEVADKLLGFGFDPQSTAFEETKSKHAVEASSTLKLKPKLNRISVAPSGTPPNGR